MNLPLIFLFVSLSFSGNTQSNDTVNVGKELAKADSLLLTKSYKVALSHYYRVYRFQPTPVLLTKIDSVQHLIADKSICAGYENQYSKLIAVADNTFLNENYEKAKSYFERAKILCPSDPYPGEKLALLELILEREKFK